MRSIVTFGEPGSSYSPVNQISAQVVIALRRQVEVSREL